MSSTQSSQSTKQLELGQGFSSFEEFKTSLRQYEMQNKQKFTIRGSRTIKSASAVKYPIKEVLVYYEVQYGCVHREGFRSSGKGIRKSSTLRMNCPATIKLRSSKCGNSLIIKEFKQEHVGHELSQTVIDHLPQKRKLDQNEFEDIQNSIELGTNKKQIQSKVFSQGGKKPLLKDLRNIACNLKKNYSNQIESIVKLLEDTYKSTKNKILTVSQKRKRILQVTNSLANLGSLSCNGLFEYRHKLLKEIELAWSQGYEVAVERVSLSSSQSAAVFTAGNIETDEDTTSDVSTFQPIADSLSLRTESGQNVEEDEAVAELNGHSDSLLDATTCQSSSNVTSVDMQNGSEKMGNSTNTIQQADENLTTKILSQINMPPVIKKRGRPRGADMTVIGLKNKRKLYPKCKKRSPYGNVLPVRNH